MVSVLLPAYNAETGLQRAADSILNQSLTDLELILIDDRSSDRTGEIASVIREADQRVRIIRSQSPHGLVSSLNQGIATARGSFVARMDADDFSHPERLRKQVEFLDQNPNISACGTLVSIPDPLGEGIVRYAEWSNGLVRPDQIRRERFIESPVVHPSMMVRSEALDTMGGYRDLEWAEDYDLWLRMLEASLEIGKVPEVLFDWHDHPDRLTRGDDRYSEIHFLQAKAHFLSRIEEVTRFGVAICGAGPTGKKLTKLLQDEGTKIVSLYDVNPRRIGEAIAGVPILHHSEIPSAQHDAAVLVSALGQPSALRGLRDKVSQLGYEEGVNFYAAS